MQIQKILQLLQQTLNPSLVLQAQNTLLSQRLNQGFITNLLIISASPDYNITIRLSALVHVKNALLDAYKNDFNLPEQDFETVKSSIHQALIQNCQLTTITPTFRQIIHILAQYEYPHNWHQIIPDIANNLQNSGDFAQLFGSIQTLKAIVSAVVQKLDHRLTLDNLCNKVILPLLALASKLFQNYNETTSFILISIFKIFSTITNFYIPEVIMLNIHSWMIFIKKLLDLNIESGNIDMNMYQLKKICLRIMFRLYQRHLKRKFSDVPRHFINDFHQKFTKGITESLLLQIINEAQLTKNSSNKNYIKLTKYSLLCLSYVYEEDRNAAIIIDNYKEKIIYFCLARYKTKINKDYGSYGEFVSKLNQQRAHLCQFIKALIRNQTKIQQERSKGNYEYNNITEAMGILGNLFGHIQKGDMEMKQLCLYLYSEIAQALPQDENQIQTKMRAFIVNIIKPILKSQDSPPNLKLRCCQILSKYSYIQIPENELTEIGEGVYGCLISNLNQVDTSSMQIFLRIHSVYAFNSLLRYDFIVKFTSSYLGNILQVYTSLLEVEASIIKCLEDMLAKFQPYIQPYGNDLIEMLSSMFFKYNELAAKLKTGQMKPTSHKQINKNQDEYDSEDDQGSQNADSNFINSCKACLGAIRQIIQAPEFVFERDELIHNLLISIFSDKDLLYVEQGFNILNQIIFKSKNLKPEYNIYFSLIVYGILPLDKGFVGSLKSQNSNYSNTLLKMLECQCADPDPDYIENTIGCLRNYISKYHKELRNQTDKSAVSFLTLILNSVKYIHQNPSENITQSDRSIILTLYMSLIEWHSLNDSEIKQILQNIGNWLNLEKQARLANQSNGQQQNAIKMVYCPIYLQIVLLAIHFYPQITLQALNGNWIGAELLQSWERFHVDYQLCRLLVGIADLLNYQSITEKQISSQIMNRLPQVIEKQCKIRVGEDNNNVQSDDDLAEQDKFFGMDQNTHIMGWNRPSITHKQDRPQQQQEMEELDEADEQDDGDEFNKYYESPLDDIDEIKYISSVLQSGNCGTYMSLMRSDMQKKLTYLILNAPPKFNNVN